MEFLLFRLYGPLAAWGSIAIGPERPSDAYPGKSAIIGLLAAALGIRRHEDDRLAALASAINFALRVDAGGVLLRDYHTTQAPHRPSMKGRPWRTRRDELALPRHDLNTVLSSREYRCDALYTVAVWADAQAAFALEDIRAALLTPRLPLYLGRKSCPLGLPLEPRITEADTLAAALAEAAFAGDQWLRPDGADPLQLQQQRPSLHWEGVTDAGVNAQMTITRRDFPHSRRRWQFDDRIEHVHLYDREPQP